MISKKQRKSSRFYNTVLRKQKFKRNNHKLSSKTTSKTHSLAHVEVPAFIKKIVAAGNERQSVNRGPDNSRPKPGFISRIFMRMFGRKAAA